MIPMDCESVHNDDNRSRATPPTTITMPPASLQTIPLELLLVIFSFACTDGGLTGCALNLVCKTFREICINSGVDIQTIFVCGSPKLELFLGILRERQADTRKVVSLFVSLRKEDGSHNRYISPSQSPIERSANATDLILEILHTISPASLRILHAEYSWPSDSATSLIPVTFPALTELYVNGICNDRHVHNSVFAPALEKLYIGTYFYAPKGFGIELRKESPRLTHLRVVVRATDPLNDNMLKLIHAYCGLTRPLEDMSNAWALASTAESDDDFGESHLADEMYDSNFVIMDDGSVPKNLHRIVIEFSPLHTDKGRMCGNAWKAPFQTYRAYKAVAAEAIRASGIGDESYDGRRSLLVLPRPSHVHDSWRYDVETMAKAKKDWLERSGGTGLGYWI